MAALKSARLWMGSLLICGWAASAQAENMCEENEDCPKGFTCTTTSGTTTPECAAPCKMGEECEPPPDCKAPVAWKECTPASCESDADCGDNAVCHTQTIEECSGGAAVACARDEMCPQPEPSPPPSCTTHTVKECLPRYLLPCQQDSDCGTGFSCEASEECMCSGSAGSAGDRPASDDAAFAPVPPSADAGVDKGDAAVGGETCECRPAELKHCELKEIACSTDADCPSDFACVRQTDDAELCSATPRDADGGGGVASCEPAQVPSNVSLCQPRGVWASKGPTRAGDGSSAYDEDTSSSPDPRQSSDTADAGVGPGAPNSGGELAEAPTMDSSSCSVTAPRAGSFSALFAPIGMALIALGLRSRRKQR